MFADTSIVTRIAPQ